MPVILVTVIIIALIVIFIAGAIAGIKFVEFSLGYAVENGASDFWAPDSFLAWVIGIILFLIAVGVARQVANLVRALINVGPLLLFYWARESGKKLLAVLTLSIYAVVLVTAGVLVSLWATSAFFDYTANYEHLTSFFQHGNNWAYFATFCLIQSILVPTLNTDNKD